jgi:transglutaminase-like putative cysteine protease
MRVFRKSFCFIVIISTLLGCQRLHSLPTSDVYSEPEAMSMLTQRIYHVHERLTLVNKGLGQPEKQNLWVALIQSIKPYQEVLALEITPKKYDLLTDEFGNRYAEFDLSEHPAGKSIIVDIDFQVKVNELSYDLLNCTGSLPDIFTLPELHIESANLQIVNLADKLSAGGQSVCQKVRAFYDYIGDNLVYTYNGGDWGAQAALGPMGADCTEYTALLVALSRAKGIPARYYTGLLYMDRISEAEANIEHAWPDVYLPGVGWTAMDPTLGRIPIKRDVYFAHYTPDHIIVTQGVNPSVLRGSSYWTHLYWPGNSTEIQVSSEWQIERMDN